MLLSHTVFKKRLFINVKQNILPRAIEWLRDTTNASEQENSLLNKELNNSILNYNRCFFSLSYCSSVCTGGLFLIIVWEAKHSGIYLIL